MELFSKLSTEEKLLKLRDTIGTVDEHEYILNNIISVYASTKNFQHVLPHCTLLLLENEEIRERVISFLVDNKIGEEYLTALVCSKYYVHRLCVIQLMKGCNLHKKELYNILINDEIQFVCCKALKTIPKDLYSDEELYNIIKNLFENKSDYIRCAAVYLLPHLNDINILEEIIEFILHNDSWRIKYNFSIIFHKLSKPCIKKYYKLLVECNDEYIRAEALKSLSYFLELEDRDRIIEIIKDLLTDKIDEVRTNCVKEIGVFLEKMFDENIFIMFLKFSKNDSCLEVKKEMVKIFINIFKNKNIKLCYINEVKECMQDLIISFKKEREWRARVDIIKSLIFLAERGEHIFNDSFKEIAYLLLEDEVYTVRKEAGFLFKKLIKLYGVDFYKDDDKKLLSLISHIKYQYRIAAISVVIEILNNTEDIRYLYLLDELSSDIVLGVRFALLHEIRESFINKKFKNEIINIIVAMSITSCDQLKIESELTMEYILKSKIFN